MAKPKLTNNGIFSLTSANAAIWSKIVLTVILVLIIGAVFADRLEAAPGGDTIIFHNEADLIWRGAVPYRNILIEYPPGVLPFILLAQPIGFLVGDYAFGFSIMSILAIAIALRWLYRLYGTKAVIIACAIILLLFQFFFFELDIFGGIALFGALLLLMQKKYRLTAVLLAVAVVIKGYPLVCLPVFLLAIPKATVRHFLAIFAAVFAACTLPFILLSPAGVWRSLDYQLGRPVEIGSSPAAAGYISRLFGNPLRVFISHKSYAVVFPGSAFIALLFAAAFLGAISWFVYWLYHLNSQPDPALSCLAVLLMFVLFFKAGSPQYIVPAFLTGAVASRNFNRAQLNGLVGRMALIGLDICLTTLNYDRLIYLQPLVTLLVVIKFVLVAELLVWTIKQLKRQPAKHSALNA